MNVQNSGADVEALQNKVIHGGDYQLIYAFAKDVHPHRMTDIHTAFKTLIKDIPMSDVLIKMRKEMIALHLEADDWASLICEYVAPQSDETYVVEPEGIEPST